MPKGIIQSDPESVDRQIVERLRQDGHEVIYIAEVEPSIPDDVVFDRANK